MRYFSREFSSWSSLFGWCLSGPGIGDAEDVMGIHNKCQEVCGIVGAVLA